MTEFCSIDRVTYPLPCQQSYMRWSAHSLPPLDTVSQGRRESGLQQMHPEALQNVRKRAFEMLDAGMNCVEIARKLSAHPQTIRKWKKHRETFGEELSVIGLKRGPKKLRPEVLYIHGQLPFCKGWVSLLGYSFPLRARKPKRAPSFNSVAKPHSENVTRWSEAPASCAGARIG